ncbi:hypothetical protein CkaCkLH20_10640 [Colletotrichum karsti]|uniref:Uncharacterized protein n=1 Tax=Colletotrichum karsti TaxID=1095194 RepID=A0A9P6LG01_9PEZI|nr:uncharacterized protein CkaCkLH20_10640 [Colletotrichum karsti]KAF9872008.1 hypothetical protein CkaCkLH20_10640 [Colletotrichum karsti]
MKFSILGFAAAAAMLVSATPLGDSSVEIRDESSVLETRQTSSGCYYFASPTCCVPTVCMCAGSRIYQINRDNQNRGLHGCDPPWGFIGTGYTSYPGSCCRLASNGAIEKAEEDGSVQTIEASPMEA